MEKSVRKEHRHSKGTEKSSKKSREAKKARHNGGGDAHEDGAAGGSKEDDTEGYASSSPGEGADDEGNEFLGDNDDEYSSEDN